MSHISIPCYSDMHRRLIELLIEHSFQYSEEPRFKLACGDISRFYFNCKKVTLDPEGQWIIGNMTYEKIDDPNIQGIGGLTLGADAMSTATALISWLRHKPIQAFIVRKVLKDHGIIAPIEGKVKPGAKVVVVDDVITTGGSTIQAIKACKENGFEVVKAIALVDRQERDGRNNILQHVPEVDALVTRDEVMEVYSSLPKK